MRGAIWRVHKDREDGKIRPRQSREPGSMLKFLTGTVVGILLGLLLSASFPVWANSATSYMDQLFAGVR